MALARRRSGESGFRINCGEDLWLTDKAIHRLRGILDKGGVQVSIGSAARGRLVGREKGNSETGWSQSRTMFSAALRTNFVD